MVGIALTAYLAGTATMSQDQPAADAAGEPGLRLPDDRGHLQGRLHAVPQLDSRRGRQRPAAVHGVSARSAGEAAGHLLPGPDLAGPVPAHRRLVDQRPADDRRLADDPAGRDDGARAEGLQAAALLPRDQPGGLHDARHRHGAADRHRRRPVPHDQPRHVQELPVPHGRLRGKADRHDRPGESRRPGPQDARDVRLFHHRGLRHLRRAAPQRLLLQGTGLRRRPGARLDLLYRRGARFVLHGRLLPEARPRRLFRQAQPKPART